jgi:hypothetical protein
MSALRPFISQMQTFISQLQTRGRNGTGPENTYAEILLVRTAPSASVVGSQSDVAAPYGFPSRRP